jgi:hypothetical protein
MATGGNIAATRYTLTLGPDGSFINESTGRVSWVVPTFNLKTLNFSIFENKGSLIIKKYSETEIKQKQKLRFF